MASTRHFLDCLSTRSVRGSRRRRRLGLLLAVSMSLCSAASGLASDHADTLQHATFPGTMVLTGTVSAVRGDQTKIAFGQLQPRFLPAKYRRDKGLPDLRPGDRVEVALNDHNLIVDAHMAGEASRHHIVEGELAQPLVTGHHKAVIVTKDERELAYVIRPLARSAVASIPVGAPARFLVDELGRIADVRLDGTEGLRAARSGRLRSPSKNGFIRVSGEVIRPLEFRHLTIRTEAGLVRTYEVRPLIRSKLQRATKGREVLLLLDETGKVTDAALSPFHQADEWVNASTYRNDKG